MKTLDIDKMLRDMDGWRMESLDPALLIYPAARMIRTLRDELDQANRKIAAYEAAIASSSATIANYNSKIAAATDGIRDDIKELSK